MNINKILKKAYDMNASDLHISVGLPPVVRIYGRLKQLDIPILQSKDTNEFCLQLLNDDSMHELDKKGEIDLSLDVDKFRFRLNVFRQKGSYSMAFRFVNLVIPSFNELGLPNLMKVLCKKNKGMVLITGPTGTGKTTTLSAMVDWINTNRDRHIVTLEEPIEYLHKHKKCIVNQREIGSDSLSYANALRAALRQDPDVILIGEMRDLESIQIALTAAETGHLVLSTLHTTGAANTIDRIIDAFPPYRQVQIRMQLSIIIQGIVSQRLIPNIDKSGLVLAYEVLLSNPAIRNLIREGKTHQINNVMETNTKSGMITMDKCIMNLYKTGRISYENVVNNIENSNLLKRNII